MKTIIKFNELTVTELKKIAKKEKIKGYSKLNKAELIKLLKKYKNKKGGDGVEDRELFFCECASPTWPKNMSGICLHDAKYYICGACGRRASCGLKGAFGTIGVGLSGIRSLGNVRNIGQCKCINPSTPDNSNTQCKEVIGVLDKNGNPVMGSNGKQVTRYKGTYICGYCKKPRTCVKTMCHCLFPGWPDNSDTQCREKTTYTCTKCAKERPCAALTSANAYSAAILGVFGKKNYY